MKIMEVNNADFNNNGFYPGSTFKIVIWYLLNTLLFNSYLFPFSKIKIAILKLFGAKIGEAVVLKPKVNIKYPWFLEIGKNTWIGENVWIDNLCLVKIGNNVCISQGALLLSGNHNYKKSSFDLIIKPIVIEDGCWIGSKAVICQGTTCKSHSILTVASVLSKDTEPYAIYQGNPAIKIRNRVIS